MKARVFLAFVLCCAFAVSPTMQPASAANQINQTREETMRVVKKAINNTSGEANAEDPDEVFARALSGFSNEFPDYLNIAGLNVANKESIILPDFDINYNAPDFSDVMYDYQVNLEGGLTDVQWSKYEGLRREDYNFDRYVALNAEKYVDTAPTLKYVHQTIPASVLDPVTPLHPAIVTRSSVLRLAGVVTLAGILSSAGLAESAISAFTACVSTMTAGLSTSWIPFIGWVLAVALIVGALIALVVVIVKNWNAIKTKISEIRSWFLEEFVVFSSYINSFFDDAVAKGNESTVAQRQVIGGRTLVWRDAHMTRDTAISISTSLRRNKDSVLLMKDISFPRTDEMSWWIADGFVPVEYVKKFKLYETFNISTYTWYNSTAKSLLYEGTATYMHDVYGYKNIVYHRFTEMKRAVYGWNHYHVGKYNVLKGYAEAVSKVLPIHQVHSFFGLAYIRLADNQGFASYPSNP